MSHRAGAAGCDDAARKHRGRVLWGLTLVGTGIALPASAQPVTFSYRAPEACPSLDQVRPIFDAVIPEELRDELADTRVAIEIVEDGGYHATIHVEHDGHVGERVVDGERCAEVARSALIVVSVALADAHARETAEPLETPTPEPSVPEEPASGPDEEDPSPVPTTTTTTTRSASPTGGWGLALGAVSGLGDGPLAPQIAVTWLAALPHGLWLGARVRSAPYVSVRDGGERVARAASATLGPVGCGLATLGAGTRVGGCVSLDVGALVARGLGTPEPLRDVGGFGEIVLSPTIVLGRRRALRCSADLSLRMIRPRYVVTGVGEVGRVRTLGWGASCGVFFFAS